MTTSRHSRHARRRNLRTATIAAGVLAGITLPVGAAFADASAVPSPPTSVSQPGMDANANADANDGGGGDAHVGGDWKPDGDKPTAPPTAPPTDVDNGGKPDDNRRKPDGNGGTTDVDNGNRQEMKREAAGSKQLPGGYVAHLYKHVNSGPTTEDKVKGWEAEVHRVKGGGLATTLKAFGNSASAKADGYTFTLTASGQVSSWKNETSGDKPDRPDRPQDQVKTKTVKLKDGGTAKINWILGTPRAELLSSSGKSQGALERPGATKTLASGLKVTLQHGGDLKQEWTGTKPKPKPEERYVSLWDGGMAKVSKNKNGVWKASLHDRKDTYSVTIDARSKPSAVLKSGLKVSISQDGKIAQQWTKNKPKPKPKPDGDRHDYDIRTVKLKDGGKAVVSKARNGEYGAQLFDKGGNVGPNLDSSKRTVTLKSGLKVTLTKSGKILQEWTGTTTGTTGTTGTGTGTDTGTTGGKDQQIPKGGVKAGAEGAESDGTALLAAGGGAAAAAAAGLGFTMLRRGRRQGGQH
ncbi:hypothetical protein [Streptomyces sp. NPDC059009]|uniref:hypothetical protein n=1 Tax=Streptomyces sp. NPDC059009 TaxID=3346694 RepID=UPI0036872A52